MKKYLVLHDRMGRFGSVELTEKHRDQLRAIYCCHLMQTDASGTEHWYCLSPWGKSPQGKKLEAEYVKKYGESPHGPKKKAKKKAG